MWYYYLFAIICSYFLGNINNSLIISKLKKKDIRKMGSGNPGSINMTRSLGTFYGSITFFLDVMKGVIPCLLGWYFLGDYLSFSNNRIGIYVCGLSVIIGHIFPIFLKFKGGKGVACSIGICMVAAPILTLIVLIFGFFFLLFSHMGAISSFLVLGSIFVYLAINEVLICKILIIIIYIIILFAHRRNIINIIKGREKPVYIIKKKNK